ncbi:MAG: hypothetical protein KIT72_08920 [Polyangiaceae bacterium]|nr:hypothetical protein [Polyangiaceae bacterium]
MLGRHPRDPPPQDRMKGISIAAFVQWYATSGDPERLRAVIGRLRPEHQALLAPERPSAGIIASTWYPSALVHELLDGLTEGLSERELDDLAERGEGAIMDATLHGTHRLFFRMLVTPERYARYSQALWGRFFDSGRVESWVDGRTVSNRVSGWRGYHCFICKMNREALRIIHQAMGEEVLGVDAGDCRAAGALSCVTHVRLAPRR